MTEGIQADALNEFERLQKIQSDRRAKINGARAAIAKQANVVENSLGLLTALQVEIGTIISQQRRMQSILGEGLDEYTSKLLQTQPAWPETVNTCAVITLRSEEDEAACPIYSGNQRAEMEKEMREHMNMHRTMVSHMDTQLAQFSDNGGMLKTQFLS